MHTWVEVVRDVIAFIETQDGIVKIYKIIGRVVLATHVAPNVMVVVVIAHPEEKHGPWQQEKS